MRLFCGFRLRRGPLTALGEPRGPIKSLDPEPVALQRIAELLGQLQGLTGLVWIGQSRADAVLPGLGTGWVGGPRRHRRPQTHPGTRHVEGDPMPFQLQGSVLAAEPGVGGGHRTCLTTCLIVVDPCRFA